MNDTARTKGFEESAQRIEQVLEVMRDEIANAGTETDWAGLSRQFATGAEETRELALKLGSLQRSNESDALIHTFMLRQLEISLAFISKLSNQVVALQEGLASLESELDRLKNGS